MTLNEYNKLLSFVNNQLIYLVVSNKHWNLHTHNLSILAKNVRISFVKLVGPTHVQRLELVDLVQDEGAKRTNHHGEARL